jgi:hypothetical protein
MPGRDRTGPLGLGPLSGRGLGMCVTGVNALRYGARAGRGLSRGVGLGLGPGVGRRLGLGLMPGAGMGVGLGLARGIGRGLTRGLGYGVILGIGYGCVRAYGRYRAVNQAEGSGKELLQDKKDQLETDTMI